MVANPIFCRTNWIDDAVLSANTTAPGFPASNLATDDIKEVWRASIGTQSSWILADLGASRTVGVVALVNTNLLFASVMRVRVSTVDATGGAGDAHNSGLVASGCDPVYRIFVYVLPTPATGRYVRIDATAFVEMDAGRMITGPTFQPSRNLSFGVEDVFQDHSRITQSLSGVRWIDREEIQRGVRGTFNGLNIAEARDELREINRVLGVNRDFLMLRDADSTNKGRDSLWGYLAQPISYVQEHPDFIRADIEMWNRL
jgi:hypothetical protein